MTMGFMGLSAEPKGFKTTQLSVDVQVNNTPVNGRNFLDLAQLEPGVQIQDGTNFDPIKVGYSSISFGGRFGRTRSATLAQEHCI